MGTVLVVLDQPDYSALDAAMTALGYSTTIPTFADGEERALCLPRGCYHHPTHTAERMRDDAWACVVALGVELGCQIVATDGRSAWIGLVGKDWPS